MNKKTAVIIGAGPAGITAATEMLKETNIKTIILEETTEIGGISRTEKYKGYRMDIGGHRFFSKNEKVMKWWQNLMPIQGEPAKDDIILQNKEKEYVENGPNPEKEDKVILIRHRVSRILFLGKFFDYPISIKVQTFINMGFVRTIKAGFSYIGSKFHKRKEKSLEDFMVNRFGKVLYQMFFKKYNEKLWGVSPAQMEPDWGAQRIKGLSLSKAVFEAIKKPFMKKDKSIDQKGKETSLIEQFLYPKFGPGQLWELAADEVIKNGGQVKLESKVVGIKTEKGKIVSVVYENSGNREEMKADYVISSMPIKDLIFAIEDNNMPSEVKDVATKLPYRDFMTVGLLVNKLKIKNKTKIKTVSNIVPDTWIYVQEPDVKLGRIQIFNNWSPYLLKDVENTVWIGLEYFCNENDEYWNMSDEDFIKFAIDELVKIDVIDKSDVLDSHRIKVKKAYPAYFGTYEKFDIVKDYLDSYSNLYCIGRNGQHRYNNMDHSMLTAMKTVDNIKNNILDKSNIWAVNTEEEYHEVKAESIEDEEINVVTV
jgi:protoporphyrinogen oxidase